MSLVLAFDKLHHRVKRTELTVDAVVSSSITTAKKEGDREVGTKKATDQGRDKTHKLDHNVRQAVH